MKIYKHGEKEQETTVMVQPGRDYPDVVDWMVRERRGDEGVMVSVPKMFSIRFERGAADVDDRLGRYMVDNGYASASRVVPPDALEDRGIGFNDIPGRPIDRTQITFGR